MVLRLGKNRPKEVWGRAEFVGCSWSPDLCMKSQGFHFHAGSWIYGSVPHGQVYAVLRHAH